MASSSSSSSDEDAGFYCDPCERSFGSWHALHSHLSHSSRHFYCLDCQRDFRNANDLRNHRNSKRHQPQDLFCPRCRNGFVSASALAKHLEQSRCLKLKNRQIVDRVRAWEQETGNDNFMLRPRIGWHDDLEQPSASRITATEASFDGEHYVCPVCSRRFLRLSSLNQHLNSNVHEPSEFWCRKCRKEFKLLSALVGHVESETCGAMSLERMKGIVRNLKNMRLTQH